jgi:hypothetical protein
MALATCSLSLILLAALPACAQEWMAVRLHPEAGLGSGVEAVNALQQGGGVLPPEAANQAGYWRGTPASWTLLSPPKRTAVVYGMDDLRQVGELGGHAVLWYSTPQSRVDLHTAPLVFSEVRDVRGNMQVGLVRPWGTSADRAALWRGTAASYVDLHPPGAVRSTATATDGVLQGGAIFVGVGQGTPRAVIWNGTAQSMVDLHPLGMQYSGIAGMAPGVQVGSAFGSPGWPTPPIHRASLWQGSAASWVDLTPPGAQGIWQFTATTGRIHVGRGTPGGVVQAHVNFGTPEAWTNLHQFLPPGYSGASVPTSVYQDGDTIYVGGRALSDATGEHHAFLWIGVLPCWVNCDESTTSPILNVADFSCFLQRFATGDGYANCDHSTTRPVLNVADFSCFLQRFAAGCDK